MRRIPRDGIVLLNGSLRTIRQTLRLVREHYRVGLAQFCIHSGSGFKKLSQDLIRMGEGEYRMARHLTASPTRFSLLLCCTMLIGVGLAAIDSFKSLAANKKLDPYAAAAKDPRSGAALNRDAALRSHRRATVRSGPRRVFFGTVNNPASDLTAQDTQSETSVVQLGAANIVAAFNDSGSFSGVNNHFTGFAWSDNNGLSWTDGGTLPNSPVGDAGDPNLAYHAASNSAYLATLGFSAANAIQVFKSSDSGHTWALPVNAFPGFPSGDLDKEWIAVDNFAGAGNGNVYVCATDFGGVENIVFSRSTDGGATFGPSGGTLISTGGQGCNVVVTADHNVYVFYYRGTGGGGQGGDNKLYVRGSADQGVTFGVEVLVADLNTTSVNGDLALLGGLRSNSFVQVAANPVAARPYLYAIYNDIDPANPTRKAEIFLVYSTTGGATWSAPLRVNDDVGGDQFFPSIAFISGGERFMISYYSRSHDASNLKFHRRGRLGVLGAAGNVGLYRSFEISPDTPVVIGQDPVINSVYMGDYDQNAGDPTTVSATWSDNRLGDAFHSRQPDVRFARITAPPLPADLAVSITGAPPSINLGENVTFTVTATATGGNAADVFLSMPPAIGLHILSANSATGGCDVIEDFVGCSLGTVTAGSPRKIQVVATAVYAAATRTLKVIGTTSSRDTNAANDIASASVTVAGSAVAVTRSTGNVAIPLPDLATTTIPLNVPDEGALVRVAAQVRLNHTFDSDLVLSLIAPNGQTVLLANRRGGAGVNYGSGPNDCTGAFTVFDDVAVTPISAGAAPFAGSFKPEQLLAGTFGGPIDGQWKLRITDNAGGDVGTLGCFRLVIFRVP
jgi:subtilisin-like proprotein convertase family protein